MSSQTSEKKIAWLTVGTILCGLWTLNFIGVFIYAVFKGAFSEGGDMIGVALVALLILIFAVLPGFITWRCFKASRRLTRERQDKFVQKRAFE